MPRKACRVTCVGEPGLVASRQRAWRSISGCRVLSSKTPEGADVIDVSAGILNGRAPAPEDEGLPGAVPMWQVIGLRDWSAGSPARCIPELWRRFARKTTGLHNTLANHDLGQTCSIRSRWLVTERGAGHLGVAGIEGLWDMAGQQLDVCMWLAGRGIAEMSGSLREVGGGGHLQALLQMDGGAVAFLDLSNVLPPGAWPVDQLEWVGTEGMACDQPLEAPGSIEGYSFVQGNRRVDWTPDFPGARPDVAAARHLFCEAALEWLGRGEVPADIRQSADDAATVLRQLRNAIEGGRDLA